MDSSEHRSHMHRLFQERKIITYQFGVQLEVPASAIKAGRAGVPMMITTLGGAAINFKVSVDAYREVAQQSGFDPASLPVATTSLFYTAKIHKMHLVNITLTLMLVCLHCAVMGIRNSNLQMQ